MADDLRIRLENPAQSLLRLDTITSIKSGGKETPERPNSMRSSGGGADAGLATDILRVKALAIGFGAFAVIQN
jgi:hypothetical protein